MNVLQRITLAVCLTGVFGASATAAQTVFKLATIAPEGSAWMTAMRAGGKEIAERTDDRVKFKFYGGGVMGNDKKVMRKMRIGQLHGGAFVSSGVADRYPDIQLYGLPLLFDNQAEVDFVRERMDPAIFAGMEEAGLVCLGIASGGFAQIMSSQPVRNEDDLKGQKVWVPEGDPISYATMETLGLSPVTLPVTDVLTGLQTGLVDIVGSSPVGALVLQWHTKIDYITDLPVAYLYGILAIEKKAFMRLSEADRDSVAKVFAAMYDRFEVDNLVDDKKALAALVSGGVEVVTPAVGLVPRWKKDATDVRQRLAKKGTYSADKLAQIDTLLKEFRTSRSADTAIP